MFAVIDENAEGSWAQSQLSVLNFPTQAKIRLEWGTVGNLGLGSSVPYKKEFGRYVNNPLKPKSGLNGHRR